MNDDPLATGLAMLSLPSGLIAPLNAYLDLLQLWSRSYNLTAIRDRGEMVIKHVLDSLVIHPHVPNGARLADIGSGAGLPGLLLALARPDLQVNSVESAGKKARFQREAVRVLGLGERVQVLAQRAELAGPAGGFDCLSARAFGTLSQILDAGGHLLRSGGSLLALKGRDPVDEIATLPPGYRHVTTEPLRVPGLEAERHLVRIDKQ